MRFREQQVSARSASRRLVVAFVLTIALTVLGVNGALWLAWWLTMSAAFDALPRLFFEVNTAMTLLFVLGGWWLESLQLQKGGAHVARWLGGREITTPRDLAERRFRNVVHEMAIASGLPMPRVFVLDREDAINAFASGWVPEDSAISVTHGALLRLTRDELQGVVAHEFGHIQSGDTRLNMRLIGMVFGLQMVHSLGQTLAERDERGQYGALAVLGWALMGAGSIGWLAGRLLKAAVSRQREFLADAHAVQYTRLPKGLGQALLKVAGQRTQGQRMRHHNAELVSHLLLSSDVWVRGGWLASHPPLAERIRRLLGRVPPDLPAEPVEMADEPDAPDLPALPAWPAAALAAAAHLAPVTAQPDTARQHTGPAIGAPHAAACPPPDALALPQWSPPSAIRLAVLAQLVPGPTSAEYARWTELMRDASPTVQQQAEQALAAVCALPARQRQPWLEHALHRARSLPPGQQAQTLSEAAALEGAAGNRSLPDFLRGSLVRHTLAPEVPAVGPPTGGAGQPLSLADAAPDIGCVSQALGHCAKGLPPPQPADWASLALAIQRLAALAPLQQPSVVKQWVQEGTAPGQEPPQAWADALRCICRLIGSPLPPALEACFDALPSNLPGPAARI